MTTYDLEQKVKKLEEELALNKHWVDCLEEQRDDLDNENEELKWKLAFSEREVKDLREEVIHLKAKLYDMIQEGEKNER